MIRLWLWLQGKWNRLSPDGKVATILGLVGLAIAGTALVVQLAPRPVERPIAVPLEGIDLPVRKSAALSENLTTVPSQAAAVNATAEGGDNTAIDRQCPSETFASAQGDWNAELICDGQTYTGRFTLHFVSAKGLDAELTFNRAQQDSGEEREPLTSRLHGEFEGNYDSLYLNNRRDPLRVGYPLVELQFTRGGLGASQLRARVFDLESRRSVCGTLTARRATPSFGGRSYPQIVFNRRRPSTPDFDPNDC